MTEAKEYVFDLCVIGCGPAGFAAAMRALDIGKHVCIIEGGEIGGTGVKWGALASKTMWELAKDFHIAGKVDRGYRCSSLRVNFHKVYETVMEAVKERQYQMRSQIETFSPRVWSGPGSLTYKTGMGSFIDKETVAVTYPDGRQEQVKARFTMIATGSRPRTLPHIEIDHKRVITSDDILGLKTFPRRMAIIGAGVTGCEYATIFAQFGQTQVYLVDHMDTVIPWEDEDVSRFVSNSLKDHGVEIFQRAKVKAIDKTNDHLEVILDFADGHSRDVNRTLKGSIWTGSELPRPPPEFWSPARAVRSRRTSMLPEISPRIRPWSISPNWRDVTPSNICLVACAGRCATRTCRQ